MKRNLISFAAAFVMLFSAAASLPQLLYSDSAAICASALTSGNWEYTVLSDKTVSLDKYTGTEKTVSTPSEIAGYKVSSIGEGCFANNSSITSVTVQGSITSIGNLAFSNCSSLISASLPDSIKSIPFGLFSQCTKLNKVNIPSKAQKIDDIAFINCSALTSVSIPASVVSIGSNVFSLCEALKSIIVASANKYYCSVNGVLFNKDRTKLILCPSAVSNVSIPSTVKTICSSAFNCCNKLTSLNIPASVETIEDNAVIDCKAMLSINVEASNQKYRSFNGILYSKDFKKLILCPCAKTSVSFANGVESISPAAFYMCNRITSVNIPSTVTSLGDNVFTGCSSLVSAVIPSKVKTISNYAFSRCESLCDVTISEGVQNINSSAFSDCPKLKSILIPSSVKYICSELNRNCAFGYTVDPQTYKYEKVNGFRIYCCADTAAESYAKDNGFEYTYIPQATRLAGSNRFSTAVEISKKSFDSSENVVLAYGYDFADALAGVPLANMLKAPILLSKRSDVTSETLSEIKRLGAKKVTILGGTSAIDDKAKKMLTDSGLKVERIGGEKRFGTAVKIAKRLAKEPEELFFVYSHDFADALSASAVAAIKGAPIIYLRTDGSIDKETQDYLTSVKGYVKKAYVIGGSNRISDKMMSSAAAALGLDTKNGVVRISGSNRYLTCNQIGSTFADQLSGKSICIATGKDFPDALTGSVLAANNASYLMLTSGTLKKEQSDLLKSKEITQITVFGGTSSVAEKTVRDICIIKAYKPSK